MLSTNISNDTINTIKAISDQLQTGLDIESIHAITTLIESGVHPDALTALILELRREIVNIEKKK